MKAILLTILSFYILTTSFAQKKQLPVVSQNVKKHLCQKWVLITMIAQGKSANVPASEAMYLTYKSDGSYTDSSSKFNVSYGTWTYDSKTNFLYTTEKGGKSKMKVVGITTSELIMEMEYPTVTMTSIYKRAD